jgi:hypothetical protein
MARGRSITLMDDDRVMSSEAASSDVWWDWHWFSFSVFPSSVFISSHDESVFNLCTEKLISSPTESHISSVSYALHWKFNLLSLSDSNCFIFFRLFEDENKKQLPNLISNRVIYDFDVEIRG